MGWEGVYDNPMDPLWILLSCFVIIVYTFESFRNTGSQADYGHLGQTINLSASVPSTGTDSSSLHQLHVENHGLNLGFCAYQNTN